MDWKPHPPPLAEWPEHVKQVYEAGCVRIDRLRAANYDADGVLAIPFRCYGCDEWRADLAMLTGEKLPLCVRCLGFHPADVPGLNGE